MENKKQESELSKKVFKGLEKAYEKMVEFKKYKKTPLVISQNGQLIEIPYQDIPPTAKYE
jgi:hypothetical protein